jgi:hypothetical protein
MGSWIADQKDDENEDDFGLWAFGENFKNIVGGKNFVDAWNERHSDKLILEYSNSRSISLEVMVELWRRK